jgi:hypothetical protein
MSPSLWSKSLTASVIKSRKIRWAGHVARLGGEACKGSWWRNLRERDHWGYPDVDGENDIKMDLQKVG